MNGLTEKEVKFLRQKYGFNEIESQKQSFLGKLPKTLISPISIMLIAAAILSLFIGKTFDCYFILSLFALNSAISLWQEHKADKAIEKLSDSLSVKTNTFRNGKWSMLDSRELLPGDYIEMIVGDLVPADCEIIDSKNLSANESVLTGESLPKDKSKKDRLYSGSFVATGWVVAKITATGRETSFSKTLLSVDKTSKRSLLEKDILSTSKFLMITSLTAICILTLFLFLRHQPLGEIALLDISLFIAGVPVALPVVMSVIISLGVLQLSRKKAIVRRLSTLEDLANVSILLSDKTGTLTKNEIIINKIEKYGRYSEEDILTFAYASALKDENNVINKAILDKYHKEMGRNKDISVVSFIPADSERKRATAQVRIAEKEIIISSGAPQVIKKLCRMNIQTRAKYERDISNAAADGYRTIAISVRTGSDLEKDMSLAGLLFITDPPRPETNAIIKFLNENGIAVKMLTGDNIEISRRISEEIGLQGLVIKRSDIDWTSLDRKGMQAIATFAEILPKDKYKLVESAKRSYTVAVTGDGVNDLPAMESADVSIAVSNAADALKSSADIVLTSSGIEVIRDAIIESRKIFSRLYSYSVYRISESFRLIIAILILGLFVSNFPLTPIQLILLAFLNDIPIMSLAFNRVQNTSEPQKIKVKSRLFLSTLFGSVGILNSILMYFIAINIFQVSLPVLQTMFFLKLAVSGHMLIYVAHTKERWWRFLPSKSVILTTTITQIVATAFAVIGVFMVGISWKLVAFVWIWAFFWMQVSELSKIVQQKLDKPKEL